MNSHSDELNLLVSALVDESIDDAELARLNELIERDPLARAYYIRFLHHHADLGELLLHPLDQIEDSQDEAFLNSIADADAADTAALSAANSQPISSVPIWHPARYPLAVSFSVAILAVSLLICVMALIAIPLYRQAGQLASKEERQVVGRITRLHQPKWPEESQAGPGRLLRLGDRIDLRGGFAEISFRDGASVVVRGPAVFQATSTNSGHLEKGELTAIVPPQAIGFLIASPCMNVVDLGTEFGVAVEENGTTSVDVFTGNVEVAWVEKNGQPTQRVTLSAGEAARATAEAKGIERVEPNQADFVRADTLDAMIDEAGLAKSRNYLQRLEGDSNVVALYRFEKQDNAPNTLVDASKNAAGPFDGQIDGPQWVSGRWPEKQALRFDGDEDRVHLDLRGETFAEFTLAGWVSVYSLEHRFTAIVHSNTWDREGATHWTILDDGRLELAIYGNKPDVVQSDLSAIGERLGSWMHVAVVYDSKAQQVTFYVDGVKRGAQQYTRTAAADFKQAQIGNWQGENRSLMGRMDELVLFRKALSAEQIQQIYRAGLRNGSLNSK